MSKKSFSLYVLKIWISLYNSPRLVMQKSFEMSNKELFTFEKYEIWMVESARIIGFQLFCRFLKSTTTKLNTICFWQRKAKAPSGEFHFASYFSFRPFIHTQPRTKDAQWSLFTSMSQTFGLGQTIWADKFWGIWGTARPRDTLFLVPEKNCAAQNRTS